MSFTIKVGLASCGLAAGAADVQVAINEHIKKNKLKDIEVKKTACIGMCFAEPIIEFVDEKNKSITYGRVTPENVGSIIDAYVEGKPIKEDVVVSNVLEASENENYNNQVRIVLRNTGIINPESIDDYLARDGYKSLEKAIKELSPEDIIKEMQESGLRGRGGAGFPTGLKWKFAYDAMGRKKYVVCNADEGDPGAFMDRSILEGDPHSVLEGMAICAYTIGANEGYIYCRAEYPLAIKHLNIAIKAAKERGFLGKNILGTDFDFILHIKEGAGAFVCGEETALMASIEGERGMPRIRPPFPAQSGLWGKPTNINNVETYANVAWIILNGAKKYSQYGTEKSAGTKVFALAGKIKNSGLIEVPMGMPLKDVIYKVGGGMKTDKPFKGVQLGGPSGGCLPAELLDTIVDYDSINKTGAIMGSGGMVVMDSGTCMVDVARFFLNFTQNESCGKCTFCRVGTKRMLEILTKITKGKGELEDLDKLETLAENIIKSSLCGLGQSAPNPVLTTLRYFRKEYEAHILDKKCHAGVCDALMKYEVNEDKCVGCTACARKCPVQAISGEVKKPHVIDQDKCIKCGVCYDVCKFDAIIKS
ncbi:MAG: 4Fe-4S binding protein [Candidatus Cloacimonetes bacterium]|nr:4Fe-4S binding protein [Candidatus Cloacimonadota bacterium]MCF7814511.1 4Fe-4S binding protein [Candidatus Cloacimonadota bacterium]MCF7869054.1 4Fe-4S binding protein [Candidatus Cloacimonadota bacterium]MCF7884449.1 4Fe-4S binding protein [Candidatus Cloacimonadota bacterium]